MLLPNCYFWDFVLFLCIFKSCQVVGILPSKVNGEDFTIGGVIQTASGIQHDWTPHTITNKFGLFYIGLILSIFVLWLLSVNHFKIDDNFTTEILPFLCVDLALVCVSLFKRRQSTVKCIFSAAQIYCLAPPSLKPCWFIFFSMTLYLLGTAIVNSEFVYNFHFLLVKQLVIQILMVPSVSACLLFCCLCLIGERAYRSINLQLQQLADSHPSATSTTQLDILMYHHEKLTDFMEEINDCFSFDLVIFLADFILNLIANSYTLSWNKFQQFSSIMSFLTHLFLFGTLQHKFFMICSCSQQISKQVNLMRINLLSIQVQQLNNRDPIFESMLTEFCEVVDARPVVITAAGFTEVNLPLIFKLIGTAVMYASAALQYYWQDSNKN